jgi:hypothetical protein
MDGRHVRLGFAARLLPAPEKKAGEMTEFSGAVERDDSAAARIATKLAAQALVPDTMNAVKP